MATLKELLKLQQQIDVAETKVKGLRVKRREMTKVLGLKHPASYGEPRQENFVSIDGLPVRIWVNYCGNIEIENLTF